MLYNLIIHTISGLWISFCVSLFMLNLNVVLNLPNQNWNVRIWILDFHTVLGVCVCVCVYKN